MDAGPAVTITSDETLIAEAVAAWRAAADAHTSRAEAAALALADHEPVAAAGTAARAAEQKAAALDERLDTDERRLRDLIGTTEAAKASLISTTSSSGPAPTRLWRIRQRPRQAIAPALPVKTAGTPQMWRLCAALSPGQLLHAADGFAAIATARASARAGRLRADAAAAEQRAS